MMERAEAWHLTCPMSGAQFLVQFWDMHKEDWRGSRHMAWAVFQQHPMFPTNSCDGERAAKELMGFLQYDGVLGDDIVATQSGSTRFPWEDDEMENGIVKMDTGLDSLTVKRVRALLGCIPNHSQGMGFQKFYGLRLIRADGVRFMLSIQGSDGHYCSPRTCLPSLADYEEVEIGIIPDECNESSPYRFGRTYEYDSENDESGFRDIKEGEQRRGWLQPKDVGFNRVQEHQGCDDVLGWVPVRDLVADLAEFFDAGGVIDASSEETQKWLDKIVIDASSEETQKWLDKIVAAVQ